ncbi:MAG: hypothetical protein NTY77_14460 [Elusimicrobia bacterium]|nr:hypothetical protein [Elusimicrobiota bacterium]
MRTVTWLSVVFAWELAFSAVCAAAPSGGNAKKPAPQPDRGAAPSASGPRLCIAAATKADGMLAQTLARDIGTRGPAFKSAQVTSEGQRAACDLIATVAGEGVQPVSIHSVVVESAYTHEALWAGQSRDPSLEGVAAELASKVVEAFREGAASRQQARGGHPAASASSPAEEEPSAPPPSAQRKPRAKAPAASASSPAAAPSAPPAHAKRKPRTKAPRKDADDQL